MLPDDLIHREKYRKELHDRLIERNKTLRKPRRGKEVPCMNCGKIVYRSQSQLKRAFIFCSRKCINYHKTPANKGKGKYDNMNEETAQILFNEFIASKVNLVEFSKSKHMRDKGLSQVFRKYFPAEFEMNTEQLKTKGGLYKKGRTFEYRVKHYLEKIGFHVVRSAGSKSPADLIAVRNSEILFVQCKLGISKLPEKERDSLIEMVGTSQAKPVMASRPKYKGKLLFSIVPCSKGGEYKKIIYEEL